MKKILKENKAITLIALVITIVVLIILAGVLISLTLGDNGIFQRAKKAKEDYEEAAIDEQRQINELELMVAAETRGDTTGGGSSSKGTLAKTVIAQNQEYYGSINGGNSSGYGTRTFDVSSVLPDVYNELSVDNFCIEINKAWPITDANLTTAINPTGANIEITSYENGILTINIPQVARNIGSGSSYYSFAMVFSVVAYYVQ